MANFSTHLSVASLGSGFYASIAVAAKIAPVDHFFILTLAGAIGGVLPDIDLPKLSPVRRSAFGLALALIALFESNKNYSIAELGVICFGIPVIVSLILWVLPIPRVKHRGIFHSILAGQFFMILTAVIFDRIFGEPAALAWLAGLFVFIGFIIHLVLDETYAVSGGKIKRSFGTALKLFDARSLRASGLMAFAVCAVMLIAPPTKDFAEAAKPPAFFALLKDRLLPKGNWFGLELPEVALPPNHGESSAEKLVPSSPNGAMDVKDVRPSRQSARSAKQRGCGSKSCGYRPNLRRR